MSKLFFEMTETEAQLQNILNSLEYEIGRASCRERV